MIRLELINGVIGLVRITYSELLRIYVCDWYWEVINEKDLIFIYD